MDLAGLFNREPNVNPYHEALKGALENYQNITKSAYLQPNMATELEKNKLYNQYYGRDIESQIGLRGAQAGLAGSEAAKNNFMVNNPEYLNTLAFYYDQQRKAQEQQNGASPTQTAAPVNIPNIPNIPAQQQNAGSSPLATQPVLPSSGAAPSSAPALSGQPQNSTQQITQPQPLQMQNVPTQQYGQYGIPLPNTSFGASDPFGNKLLGPTALDQQNLAIYKDQVIANQKEYRDDVTKAAKEGENANQMDQTLSVFNNVMDKAHFKGPTLGTWPSHGLAAAGPSLLYGMQNEQTADNMAANLLPTYMHQVRAGMGSGQFSNLDTKAADKLNFERSDDDITRATKTKLVNAWNARKKEEAPFINYFANPTSGLQHYQARTAWGAYQNQFPVVAPDGKSVNQYNQGAWPLFTTPEAIKSIRETGTYTAPALMKTPEGKIVPVKRDKVKEAEKKYKWVKVSS